MAENVNSVASYRRMLQKTGQSVIFRRVIGQAPNATTIDATVTCILRAYSPTSPIGQGLRTAAISEGARQFIVLSDDLTNAGFPLPLAKNDKIVLVQPAPNEMLTFNIVDVDPGSRIFAGAIEGRAVGV
jgi:hypothetical protein